MSAVIPAILCLLQVVSAQGLQERGGSCAGCCDDDVITVTVTAPGSTVTVTDPGSTVTVTDSAPGATITVTNPGNTVTVTAPGVTVTVPGVTVTLPGASATVTTAEAVPGSVTDTATESATTPTGPESQISSVSTWDAVSQKSHHGGHHHTKPASATWSQPGYSSESGSGEPVRTSKSKTKNRHTKTKTTADGAWTSEPASATETYTLPPILSTSQAGGVNGTGTAPICPGVTQMAVTITFTNTVTEIVTGYAPTSSQGW
jgi:hypothetical protein